MRFYPGLLLMLVLIVDHNPLVAQQMSGMVLGNYSGVNSLIVNPSSMHQSRAWLDVQLAGAGLFLQNDALYMAKSEYRFSNFFKADYEWPVHTEWYNTALQHTFYMYDNTMPKSAFIQTRILGPGAVLIWDKHAFGISSGLRTVVSMHNVPYDVANFAYLELSYWPQHNINYQDGQPFKITSMAWGEVGISYALRAYARGFDMISAGITAKRLWGVAGMYLASSDLNYVVPDDSTILVNNFRSEMGIAMPVDYNTNALLTNQPVNGGGFGFDIGATYTRLKQYYTKQVFSSLCEDRYEDYQFRVGLALIDLGGIRYNRNARKMNIDDRSADWTNLNHFNFTSLDQVLDTISYRFYGDTVSAYSGESFMMWLPSAVSIQFDYHLKKNFYVNSSFISGFPFSKGGIVRPAELTITPRFETAWFEASLPVSLYDWKLPRIGAAIRIYGITVGTDKLGGFFHYSNFSGLDFYFSVRFFLNKGKCRNQGSLHCGEPEHHYRK
jgi:hypothetical protein